MVEDITGTAGIDTGKNRLDVAVHGKGSPFTLDNTPAGWQSLTSPLKKWRRGHAGSGVMARMRESQVSSLPVAVTARKMIARISLVQTINIFGANNK